MPTQLYLDTARLGRMHPAAVRVAGEYDRLCRDEGGSSLVESLIGEGSADWPESVRRRYPGLARWGGLDSLRSSLGPLVGVSADSDVHLAGRSAVLMRLAARALFRRCRRPLHTDLEWPAHLAVLDAERRRAGRESVILPVRDRVFRDGVGARELASLVADGYRTHGCDGLFLSAVSHDGIRFPLEELGKAMAFLPSPRFVAVDGAQAIGHTPAARFPCDALLAGGHKWVRSGRPLAMAFAPRPGSRGMIRAVADEMEAAGELDDPLVALTRQLDGCSPEPFGSTADPSALFCAAASIASIPGGQDAPRDRLPMLLDNAAALADAATGTSWRPVSADPSLRSGILLLRGRTANGRPTPPDRLRSMFQGRGVVLTAYADAVVRVSMPSRAWAQGELDRVRSALRRCR